VLWVAIAPVIPQLHQAFAHHWHIYDARSLRVYDVGQRSSEIFVRSSCRVDAASRDSSDNTSDRKAFGTPCQFSSFSAQLYTRTRVALELDWVLKIVNTSSDWTAVESEFVSDMIIFIAPKRSPPNAIG